MFRVAANYETSVGVYFEMFVVQKFQLPIRTVDVTTKKNKIKYVAYLINKKS